MREHVPVPSVYIVAAKRTPIGAFRGNLSHVPAPGLGSIAIRGALEEAAVDPGAVDQVFMGNVLSAGLGQAPARQAALGAGIPDSAPATGVSKVCGSGMQAIILGIQSILLGESDLVVAGGMESMSRAPHLVERGAPPPTSPDQMVDSMVHDGLWDPYNDFHMGVAAELCAREYGLSRRDQDAFALESYGRAQRAQDQGITEGEIVPVPPAHDDRTDAAVDRDEEPSRLRENKVPQLKPVFQPEGGTVTAANASSLNDGASAVVLASEGAVREHGLRPLLRHVAHGGHAQAPQWFTTAPVGALRSACNRAGWSMDAVDLVEINEAFSCVTMACARECNLSLDRVNVHGGAVALGHPIGASGARIVTTLAHAMGVRGARTGVAAICIGGGEALALAVERVPTA